MSRGGSGERVLTRRAIAAGRSIRIPRAHVRAILAGLLLAAGLVLAVMGMGRGALQKPVYTAGDRWVYVLQGSLAGLPGANASEGGAFELGLSGIAEVDVTGPASGPAGGIRAETHASGFLNGTLGLANMTIDVTGTFSSRATETWEGQDYLPIASNSTTSYAVTVRIIIPAPVAATVWLNATTAYAALPAFNLSVGQSGTAAFTSDLSLATSFSSFGVSQHLENTTAAAGTWNREVLARENVTVEAGTFSAYRLNESLGGFPGIAAVVPGSGANETAWFSNDVGSYVKRVAYLNGTPVAEMRLKAYTYPVVAPGGNLAEIVLLAAVPIAAVAVLLFLLYRRRKAREVPGKGSSGVGPVGELPPKGPGGTP